MGVTYTHNLGEGTILHFLHPIFLIHSPKTGCSSKNFPTAVQAMGYMASALVLSQEKDLRIRQEAEELISSAGDPGDPENPEKPCGFFGPEIP